MTPLAILKEILVDSGFPEKSISILFPESPYWHRICIVDRSFINNPLKFTAAINNTGLVWFSKGASEKYFGADVHDPNSIDKITNELKAIRRSHEINT